MAGRHRCNLPHFSSKLTSGHTSMRFVQLTLLTIFLCVILPRQFSAAQTATTALDGLDQEGLTEIVTEIVIEYETEEVITVDPQSPAEELTGMPCNGPTSTPVTEIPGSTMDIQFSITNMNITDIQDQNDEKTLRDLLVDELKRMYSEYEKFKTATITNFRNGSIIVDAKLEFTDALNVQERDEVVTILYEKVVLNGTLGELQVKDLKVLNNEGEAKDINNACDITPCLRDDMKCYSVGTSCKSTCAGNEGYCLNNAVCHENNNYIICKCKGENFGDRCDKVPRPPSGMRNENAYIGIVAAAAIAVVLLLVLIIGCGYSRFASTGKESDKSKLVPVDKNAVALEMLDEPPSVVGGVACQTMESFLLTKYMRNGVPPKPGYQHEEMQTNDSFLLAKAERERQSAVTVNTPNGTGTHPITPVAPSVDPDEPQEPQVGDSDNGISNEAFLEDEGDIVPTADAEADDPDKEGKSGVGKKIIKV